MHPVYSCQAFHPPDPQVLLHTAALKEFFSQSEYIAEITLSQSLQLALGLVEFH